MARDYAKKGSSRKSSGRGANRGSGGRKPAPRWLWLAAGLTVGLFIAFLVFLSQHERAPAAQVAKTEKPAKASTPSKEITADRAPAAKDPTPTAEAKPEKKPMSYDFYTRLPRFEVEVPEDKGASRPKPLAAPGNYVLQAGSFKSAKDAEARKAELALLGIRAAVQTVTTAESATFHRVRVGPYRDLDRLNQVRQTLRENHIDFVTLKERS